MLAPKHRVTQTQETSGWSISISPAALLLAAINPCAFTAIGCLPNISVHQSEGSFFSQSHAPAILRADDLFIRCGNAVFSGVKIHARLMEAIVSGDITVESLVDEFRTSSDSTAIGVSLSSIASMTQEIKPNRAFSDPRLGCIPTMRIAEEEAMSEKIREVAQMVGVERFYLTVGNVLRKKGAMVGLKPDGVVIRNEAERIQAKEVLEEQVREAETHKKHVFNPAVGEFVAMMGQIDEFRQLRNKIQLEEMVAQKSREERKQTDREVTEFLDEPEVKQAAAKLKTAGKKLLESSGKMRQLEAENPVLRAQASDVSPKLQGEPKVDETLGVRPQTHATPEEKTAAEMEQLFAWSRARHEFEQQRNEVMEQMAVLNERLDRFAESHPTIAKYSDKIIEGIGTLAMGIALFAGPEVTAATVLTNGATLLTYGKLFDVLIDGGSEKFIDYCALQGRTEAESVRYGTAAAGIVNKLLMFSVVKGGLKVVGSKKSGAHKMSPAEASARAKEVYKAKVADGNAISAEVNKGICDAVNKAPYYPRAMETLLQSRYDTEIISSTMPKSNAKSVRLAGKGKTITIGIDELTGEPIIKHIPFNERGMPIFDDVAKVEVRISGDLSRMTSEAHRKAATMQLKADIEAGRVDRRLFSAEELDDIARCKPKIGDNTWHHHEDIGRMQLVPEDINSDIGHIGGDKLWGMEKKK